MDNLTALFESIGPNLVYLAVIAALWLAITAVYVPGTGLIEIGALVSLALALGGMLALPVNVLGVGLMAVSMACFLALLFFKRRSLLVEAGLAFQLLGAAFLFREGVHPDVGIVLLVTAAAFAYHQLILLPGLRAQAGVSPLEADRLIGMRGQVESTIDPVGQVRVASERWSATADVVVGAGEHVRVVGRDGLTLRVIPEPAPGRAEFPPTLPR